MLPSMPLLNFTLMTFPQICPGKFADEVSFLQLPSLLEKAVLENFEAHPGVRLARSTSIRASFLDQGFSGEAIVRIANQGMSLSDELNCNMVCSFGGRWSML